MPTSLTAPKPGVLAWTEYAEPPLSADQVRIRCQHGAAKHGTELSFFKGAAQQRGPFDSHYLLHRPDAPDANIPRPVDIGNMIVGEVIELGADVTTLRLGQRVCAFGPFRQTHTTRAAACWVMPDGMDWRSAVCLDPATFALGAVRDSGLRIGDSAAVFGLGAIGLMVVQLLRLMGVCPIIGVDPLATRRAVAEQLGAALTLDPAACDAGLEIKKATEARGADAVIEYSGNARAMQAALRGVAFGGNVVAGAFPSPYPAGLDLGAEAHMNIPNIIFSRACSQPDRDHPRWNMARINQVCWRLLCEGKLCGRRIVQPVVPFGQAKDEYAKIAAQPNEYLKLGVDF